jgi:L-ornithine N5-oxygenase
LSLAIALHEQSDATKVQILEQKPEFSWSAESLPPAKSRMRTTLMQDLVSPRNPRSHFTFVNYLWHTGTLIQYTNLGLINPPRQVFSRYLKWCSRQIEELGWVSYGSTVLAIEPNAEGQQITTRWKITYQSSNGVKSTVLAKKVVIAGGSKTSIPPCLNVAGTSGQIHHSSTFKDVLPRLGQNQAAPVKIAIVGANNDALEVLEHCRSMPNATITIFLKDSAFRKRDDNPL